VEWFGAVRGGVVLCAAVRVRSWWIERASRFRRTPATQARERSERAQRAAGVETGEGFRVPVVPVSVFSVEGFRVSSFSDVPF